MIQSNNQPISNYRKTQIKLQTILDVPILASYYENKKSEMAQPIVNI